MVFEPEFYDNLVHRFRKIVDNYDLSEKLKKGQPLQKEMLLHEKYTTDYITVLLPSYG